MARYRDAVCRLCRREGGKLFLKGDRCFKPSCAIEKRGTQAAGTARRDRQAQDAGRLRPAASRKAKGKADLLHSSKNSSAIISRKLRVKRASRARTCCSCSSAVWTTSFIARVSRLHAARPAARQSRTYTGQRPKGRYPFLPGEDGRCRDRQGQEPQEPARRRSMADGRRTRPSGLDRSARRRGSERVRFRLCRGARTSMRISTSN